MKLVKFTLVSIIAVSIHSAGVAGVIKSGSKWTVSASEFNIVFDEATLDVDMSKSGGVIWYMDRNSRSSEIQIAGVYQSLSNARTKLFQEYLNGEMIGIKALLSNFTSSPEVELALYVYVDQSREEVNIVIEPTKDPYMKIGESRYPRAFRIENSYTSAFVNPSGSQAYGSLEFLGSGRSFIDKDAYAHNELYMAFWGLLKNYAKGGTGDGLVSMVGTPYDFSLNAYSSDGYTNVYGKWKKSIGRMRYERRMVYDIVNRTADYVSLSHRYRQFLIDEGRLKTLTEKAWINPNVNRLKGVVQFNRYLTQCMEDQPRWFRYTFDEVTSHSNEFMNYFTTSTPLLIHVREWHEGELADGGSAYDLNYNGPNVQAGSWAGLKRLADWADRTNNFLYLYDTYNDISMTPVNPLYNTNLTIKTEGGWIWSHSWWCNHGNYATICPVKRLALFKHNLEVMKSHGINIKAIYLDITVIMEPKECYSTEHDHGVYGDPVTGHLSREGYALAIKDFYEWAAQSGIIIFSEAPVEWAWSFVIGSFFMIPGHNFLYNGQYVPLIHLVGHDAIMGGDYVDTYHTGSDPKLFMHHLLHGLIPIARENMKSDAIWSEKISQLHKNVGFEQMIDHEYVNGQNHIQRTVFGDGTTVQVNYLTGEYTIDGTTIKPPDTSPPQAPRNVILITTGP
ncbi:hypothetical protein JXB12_06855 [candidate division KSB1 bacterium]|nr:hypothetical protein [candidate division KSB1 bacterium]